MYLGRPVWHASSGDGQTSATLFYTLAGNTATIIAMGKHVKSPVTTYEVDKFGPKGSNFAVGKKIVLG
jgi:hypothetical protein